MIRLFSSFFGFIGGKGKPEPAYPYFSAFPSLSTRKQVGITKPKPKRVINPARSGLGRPNRTGRTS